MLLNKLKLKTTRQNFSDGEMLQRKRKNQHETNDSSPSSSPLLPLFPSSLHSDTHIRAKKPRDQPAEPTTWSSPLSPARSDAPTSDDAGGEPPDPSADLGAAAGGAPSHGPPPRRRGCAAPVRCGATRRSLPRPPPPPPPRPSSAAAASSSSRGPRPSSSCPCS
jgi:hypothetical protein